MPDLFTLLTPQEAYQRLEPFLAATGKVERIPTDKALGRVLAREISAPSDLPPFPRSAMDGYAVRAEDTYGASEALPACLKVVGEVPMGCPSEISLSPGEAALVHTGSMLAAKADAVVMVENTQGAQNHPNEGPRR